MAPQNCAGLHYISPDVPNVLRLPSPLQVESKIAIVGKVPFDADRFSFNLQEGTNPNANNIVLAFNPRYDEGPVVVINDRVDGEWGDEERLDQFPFIHEKEFCLVIKATEGTYDVAVDDKLLIKFKHPRKIDFPTHLYIEDGVEITSVSFFDPLALPLVATLPGSVKVGDIYTIKVRPTSAKADFHVNVQADDTDNTVHLDVNPRMDTGEVILNSCINKEWNDEQLPEGMPFSDEKESVLVISVLQDHYEVSVDGKKFANYKHKIAPKDANVLIIKGDVSLCNVIIKSPAAVGPVKRTARRATSPIAGDIVDPKRNGDSPYRIPATFTIPEGFNTGKIVRIRANVPDWSDVSGFEFNLQMTSSKNSEILMHMYVNIDKKPVNTIIVNAYIKPLPESTEDGPRWGTEDTHLIEPFPFKKGDAFELEMHNDSARTIVKVNGHKLFSLIHRVYRIRKAHYLTIYGIVDVYNVSFS